jgi:hypothetical protein
MDALETKKRSTDEYIEYSALPFNYLYLVF